MSLFCLFAVAALSTLLDAKLYRKALSGPSSEFAIHAIPNPSTSAQSSLHSTTYIDLLFEPNSLEAATFSKLLPVDTQSFQFALFSPMIADWEVSLKDSKGAPVDLTNAVSKGSFPITDQDFVTGNVYTISGKATGYFELVVKTSQAVLAAFKPNAALHQGYLVLMTGSDEYLLSQMQTYDLIQDQTVGLTAYMVDGALYPHVLGGPLPPVKVHGVNDSIIRAILSATLPDGTSISTPMHDDGLHNDGAANDNIYSGAFFATAPGVYLMQSMLAGQNDGGDFVRTVEHMVTVASKDLELSGKAFVHHEAFASRVKVLVGVHRLLEDRHTTVRPYFELWGTDAITHAPKAICWASTLTEAVESVHGHVLEVEVDLKWVAKENAQGPFELRNVYVSDVDSSVPLSRVDTIPVTLPSEAESTILKKVQVLAGSDLTITREMREGVRPCHMLNATAAAAATAKLIMVHGYCCPTNPWSFMSEDFPGALYFFDEKKSRTHDAFAQLLLKFAADNGAETFALIGFSQGGIVPVHILNFYHSGLDTQRDIPGKRAIQSLCSPFLGSTLSGNIAGIGKIFGSCGKNYDMSLEGATLWKGGITVPTWEQTNFYYARYGSSPTNCNSLANMFTSLINDGVTEVNYAVPPFGNNRGLTTGQCHTDDMSYPAAFRDRVRNAELFANAAI